MESKENELYPTSRTLLIESNLLKVLIATSEIWLVFQKFYLIIDFRKKERFKYWVQILKMIHASLTAVFIPSELTNFNRQQLVKSRILKQILNVN